jgi:LytS/YehU family sensor histidine kinase
MIPLMRRVVDRGGSRLGSYLLAGLLAVLPVAIVPLIAGPVHWWAFGNGSLGAAWLHMMGHNLLTNLLLGTTTVGIAWSYLGLRRARELEVTAARLNAQLADARLDALRTQLEPHFLFNALNSVAVLARRGQTADVERMITRLGALLRHSLDTRAQLVTLGVELTALRHYLDIEQIRYGERLRFDIAVPDELHGATVPSFLLQPLAETCIRHGFSDAERPLHITVRGEAAGTTLRLTITDDGAGLPEDIQRAGVGLGHTRARLAGLYGDRASLAITPDGSGRGARVIIELPLP